MYPTEAAGFAGNYAPPLLEVAVVPNFSFLAVMLLAAVNLCRIPPAPEYRAPTAVQPGAVIWQDPGNIRARNLFYGPGGKEHQPELPVKFLKEDMKGHSPKFEAEDAAGKKWKAKMGAEAQPEPVAARLLWAIGYFANENYFVADLPVENLPSHLKRGQNFMIAPGHVKGVRLQRHPGHEKKSDEWSWRHNPFYGTREFNGLRVMMALLDNWDLKNENNAIFEGKDPSVKFYGVTDVGSTFGQPGRGYIDETSKNNLKAYRKTKFISKITPTYVDFAFPRLPPLLYIFALPYYAHEIQVRWVGKHIPRADARWVGSLLAQLSPEQIRDAFRAGGYSPEQVEAYAKVVQHRIEELNRL